MANPVSGSIPSWVSNLKDSTIRSDITADITAGVMTYGELSKLFVDVYSEASVAANGLSAAQYYDLVSVAANLVD
jgi:hypothetical protein